MWSGNRPTGGRLNEIIRELTGWYMGKLWIRWGRCLWQGGQGL